MILYLSDPPGPIDNSKIAVNKNGHITLKPGNVYHRDVFFVCVFYLHLSGLFNMVYFQAKLNNQFDHVILNLYDFLSSVKRTIVFNVV